MDKPIDIDLSIFVTQDGDFPNHLAEDLKRLAKLMNLKSCQTNHLFKLSRYSFI